MILKIIGGLLFFIGLAMLSPLDDIIFLPFLIIIFGPIIIPALTFIGLTLFVIGAIILGIHILPYLANPIVLIMLIVSIIILIILFAIGWLHL